MDDVLRFIGQFSFFSPNCISWKAATAGNRLLMSLPPLSTLRASLVIATETPHLAPHQGSLFSTQIFLKLLVVGFS